MLRSAECGILSFVNRVQVHPDVNLKLIYILLYSDKF